MSGLPSWVRLGAKCVCIADVWNLGDLDEVTRVPMLHEVLTVSGVGGPGVDGLQFEEVPAVFTSAWRISNVWWNAHSFRPLVTLQDDIEAHFKALLSTDHKVDA